MKATAVAEAMICAFTAITEVLPREHRQIISNILRAALAEGLVGDIDARKLLAQLVSDDGCDAPRRCQEATTLN